MLDTVVCVTTAGMKGWADGFLFDLAGDCSLGCEVIDGIFGALVKFSGEKLLVFGS